MFQYKCSKFAWLIKNGIIDNAATEKKLISSEETGIKSAVRTIVSQIRDDEMFGT